MNRGDSAPRTTPGVSSRRKKVRPRVVVATLALILAALAVGVTMLDDTWWRLLMAGGDRMGLLAKERHVREEAQRAKARPPAAQTMSPAPAGTSEPVSEPSP